MNIQALDTRSFIRHGLQNAVSGSRSGANTDGKMSPHRKGSSAQGGLPEGCLVVSIILLSGQQIRDFIDKALELGAPVFAPSNVEADVGAVQLVLAAGGSNAPLNAQQGATRYSVGKQLIIEHVPRSPSDAGLTARQADVLALMLQGKTNKAICRVLDLAEPTVKNHVTAILRTLKVSNRTEAVLAVKDMGWEFSTS